MLKEIQRVQETSQLLHTERQVEAALDEMARQINRVLVDKNPLVLCVMNGGIVVAGKLLTRLHIPLTIDAINASRYQNTTVGQTIAWLLKPTASLKDRTVLIVDDILDEGVTLAAIRDYCFEQGATAFYSAVLVNKLLDHAKPITADFVGLDVGNYYLYGYGMDYKGYLRNAAGIYAVR
jgi:hypoxanthine phosphoribosyltransferase